MIPCKDCLVLAVCKQKKLIIKCSPLYDWYSKRIHEKEEARVTSSRLGKYLPNWRETNKIVITREHPK